MAKPTSYQCNLECGYCFYLEKEQYFSQKKQHDKADKITHMSDDVLKTYVKNYIASQDVPVIDFAWQGGEPTLAGIDFFKRAIAYQEKFRGKKQITNSLQTNGILLDDQWCTFLKENNFLVGISIDGPEDLHDHYRVSKGQKPTFKKVLAAIERMKKYGVEFNTMTVVNNVNVKHPLRIYNFLKEIGATFQQYIPIVEQYETKVNDPILIHPKSLSEKSLTPFSVQGEDYGHFMIAIFDEWIRKDVGRIYVQSFDNALASWIGEPASLCIHQRECGRGLIIERNGDIYACDHYVYPQYRLGNIQTDKIRKIASAKLQEKFGKNKANVGAKCESCHYRFACNGGCPKHRIYPNSDGSYQNHLCSGYHVLFKHMDPYLCYMANELKNYRAPANVMLVADRIAHRAVA